MTITTPVLTEYCQVIPPAPKRCGRKKGARLEMIALEEGGAGGRRGNKRKEESSWNLLKPAEEDSDDDDSDFSTLSDISEGDDDEDWDEKEDLHVSNMTGNRILQVDKLASILKEHMCCRKCAVHNHTNHMRRFLQFTKEYEDKMKREEYDTLFHSRLDRLEWKLGRKKTTEELYAMFSGGIKESTEERICSYFVIEEETYGLATCIHGRCSKERKPHSFEIAPKMISRRFRATLHKNSKAKLFAINYQLAAAMQQMGCGPSDARVLVGFLEVAHGESIMKMLKNIEGVIGPIEENIRVICEKEAVQCEAIEAQKNNDYSTHECVVEGHEHGPLPKLKSSYGKYLTENLVSLLYTLVRTIRCLVHYVFLVHYVL